MKLHVTCTSYFRDSRQTCNSDSLSFLTRERQLMSRPGPKSGMYGSDLHHLYDRNLHLDFDVFSYISLCVVVSTFGEEDLGFSIGLVQPGTMPSLTFHQCNISVQKFCYTSGCIIFSLSC